MTFMQPTPQFPVVSGSLTLTEFLQTMLAGVSGLPGQLIRPKWQINPPKQPDVEVNWLAMALINAPADANAYVGFLPDGHGGQVNVTQRMEQLELLCGFYGPNGYDYMGLTRDGFQIQANRDALTLAGMGYVGENTGHRVPDLVNERWVDRWEISFFINRQILRSYPILSFLSVSGSITAVLDSGTVKTTNWKANV
jgi:hypothetical protein